MMGVAENISDLRDLLSIVAEETGALKMDDADEDSVGWTTEGPLPMTFGNVRRAHTALAALEAALSTDAEPVAYVCAADMELLAKTPEGLDISIAPKPYPELGMKMPLYADPVKTAPAVAVTDGLREAIEKLLDQAEHVCLGAHTPLDIKGAAKNLAEPIKNLHAALSAQVQDVSGWQREHEALGKLIRLLDAEPSIGDAEMAEALEHARCVWDHSHAPDGSPASPASKHGGP